MTPRISRGLLFLSMYGLWLELYLLMNRLPFSLAVPFDFIVVLALTFLVLLLVKILLDLLFACRDVYKGEQIITIFPFIIISGETINVRFSPYFSFHRKTLSTASLKYESKISFLLLLLIFLTLILNKTVLSILFTSLFLWNIVDITHLTFNAIEPVFNQYRWKRETSFEPYLYQTVTERLEQLGLVYSDLMCLLLYDAIHQCCFLIDNDLVEPILERVVDTKNVILCTGLVELLLYELSISNHQGSLEKGEQIRKQLIVINQLDFFCYTSWLHYNFECCLNREYDKIRPRKLLISNRQIL